MTDSISDALFERVLFHFRALCSIPHGSGNTDRISAYCFSFAEENGLEAARDDTGNVVIFLPASEGREKDDTIILQGHMDMVCVKTPGCAKDLAEEGLDLIEDDDFIRADGTSLGGDDGIAVAFCLALIENRALISHPKLEIVLTVDEETGMFGAAALDCSPLSGRMLINIDNEDENAAIVSCAGGMRLEAKRDLPFADRADCFRLELSGFSGGHSGTEIGRGGLNAIITLCSALREGGAVLHSFSGGSADNAIPSEASAVFSADYKQIKTVISFLEKTAESGKEPKMRFSLSDAGVLEVTDRESSLSVLEAVSGVENGVVSMSDKIDGLVQTSVNLGVAEYENGEIRLTHALRSSVEKEKALLEERMKERYSSFGFEARSFAAYPAWEYRENSILREKLSAAYRKLFGREIRLEAIHAGLECGIFCGKIPGLDCVSIGPDIRDIHSVNETLDKNSVGRVFALLCEILKA